MATITRTYMVDDLDGTTEEDVSTVQFALDKVSYEIDLSAANAARLREKMARFVNAASPAKAPKAASAKRGVKPAQERSNRDQTHAVREWARSNGYEVSERGRISKTIQEAFDAAH